MPTKAELEAKLAETEQQLAEAQDQIAQNGETEVPEIKPVEYVQPKYTTAVLLPVVVGIPLVVAQEAGCLRQFSIESDSEPIPKPVYDWLAGDGRYAPWFDGDPEPVNVEATE